MARAEAANLSGSLHAIYGGCVIFITGSALFIMLLTQYPVGMLQFLWIVDFCEFVVKFTKIDSYFALLWNSLKSTVEYIFTHIRYQIIRYFLLNCGLYEAFGELWLYRDCEITFHLPKCWGRQQCLESRKSNRMVRGCVLQIRHDAGGKPIIPKPWLAPSTMTSAILICKAKRR